MNYTNIDMRTYKPRRAIRKFSVWEVLFILGLLMAYVVASGNSFNALLTRNAQSVNTLYEKDMQGEITLDQDAITILNTIGGE